MTEDLLLRAQEHFRAGRVAEGDAALDEALQRDPRCLPALKRKAVLAFERKNLLLAEDLFRRALEVAAGDGALQNNLGVVLEARGRFEEAAACFQKSAELQPNSKQAAFNLGNAQRALGRWSEAAESYRRALALDRDYVDALHNLGALHKELAQREQAEALFRRALALRPDLIDAHVNLGATLQAMGRVDEALACFREAQRLDRGRADAIAGEAGILDRRGEVEAACALLRPLIDRGLENVDVTLTLASLAKKLGRQEEAVAALRKIAVDPMQLHSKRQAAYFGLGKLLDELDRFDEAWPCYEAANQMSDRTFDLPEAQRFARRVKHIFTAEFLGRAPRSVNESEAPVFVVGMPRSGTSLVEQILASHPAAHGAGELSLIDQLALGLPKAVGSEVEFPECLRGLTADAIDSAACKYLRRIRESAPQAARIVDKMPGNFMHLGLIQLLFPRSRIIHIRRHPLDTCLSCYFQNFNTGHEFSYDLKSLAAVYRIYLEVMDHWRSALPLPILEVDYELLVSNQKEETERLLQFCELEWDDRCLRFHETKRVVRTASYDQVRLPMYTRSAGRWRHYETHLGPLREALGV